MELDMAAFITYGDIHSICPGLAVQDMVYGLCLVCGRRVRLQIFGVELPEDILHSRVIFSHSSPSRFSTKVSKGLRMPIRALDVICRYTSVEFGLR